MTLQMAGDRLLIVRWPQAIDPLLNARAIALADSVRSRQVAGVHDVVPAYCTVGIHFEPLHTDLSSLTRIVEEEAAQAMARPTAAARGASLRIVDIPVVYGGEEGPDLLDVAARSGCSPSEVIERHAAREYRVYMLGFVPGFAYLGTVDPLIAAPRHRVPRPQVPAGSVGIAGAQTGVYPGATPGGWQLIGRTATVMFDASRVPASLLHAGDLVRFTPVASLP